MQTNVLQELVTFMPLTSVNLEGTSRSWCQPTAGNSSKFKIPTRFYLVSRRNQSLKQQQPSGCSGNNHIIQKCHYFLPRCPVAACLCAILHFSSLLKAKLVQTTSIWKWNLNIAQCDGSTCRLQRIIANSAMWAFCPVLMPINSLYQYCHCTSRHEKY